MSKGSCAKFNNATQRVHRGTVSPIVYAWETNDPLNPWYAEARHVSDDNVVLRRFPQASASRRQTAKDLAANAAYQWLRAQYPNLNLNDV